MISENNTTYQLCKTWTKRNKEIINIELKSIFHASERGKHNYSPTFIQNLT